MLAAAGSRTQDTSSLSHQCSATEQRQPNDHQPSQSSKALLLQQPFSYSTQSTNRPLAELLVSMV